MNTNKQYLKYQYKYQSLFSIFRNLTLKIKYDNIDSITRTNRLIKLKKVDFKNIPLFKNFKFYITCLLVLLNVKFFISVTFLHHHAKHSQLFFISSETAR